MAPIILVALTHVFSRNRIQLLGRGIKLALGRFIYPKRQSVSG